VALCRGAALPPTQVLRGWLVALGVWCLLLVLQPLVLCGCPLPASRPRRGRLVLRGQEGVLLRRAGPLVALFVSCDARWQCSPN